jgi:predicted AAA+ superfamily ATPase
MPEAATHMLGQPNSGASLKAQKDIILAYELDFAKHAPSKDVVKIIHLWKSMPAQLARENKKFLYQLARPGARSREYEDALLWLIQAGLLKKVNRVTKPNLPLSAYDDLPIFKLYMLDVGLLGALSGLDRAVLLAKNRLFTEFKGSLTENFVLQSLIPQLEVLPRYWTSEGKAEVDLLIQYKNHIIPVEIKAEENTKSKSMGVYFETYQPQIGVRFSLKNLSFQNGILNIPLFLADKTTEFLDLLL